MSDIENEDDGLNMAQSSEGSAPRRGRPPKAPNPNTNWGKAKLKEMRDQPLNGSAGDPDLEIPSGSGSAKVHNLFPPPPKAPKSKPKKNLDGVKNSIIMLHAMIALKTDTPELCISEDEAHLLAESGSNLLDYYKIKIDGKAGAALSLAYAVTIIYGPRAFALVMKTRAASAEAATRQAPQAYAAE